MRRDPLRQNTVCHVFSKSIAGYRIFRDDQDYSRMVDLMKYYRVEKPPTRFSAYSALKEKEAFHARYCSGKDYLVDVICYCLMPTHLHIALKQLKDNGIAVFMGNVLNSYSRYFNTRAGRKGPLWQSRFKHVEVDTDEQLAHLTRYIHLNPVTEYLVDDPAEWAYSSYMEFIGEAEEGVCSVSHRLFASPSAYRDFVADQRDYQRSLAMLKSMSLE